MITVKLDPMRRLIGLEVKPKTPAQGDEPEAARESSGPANAAAPDSEFWKPILDAAGMKLGPLDFLAVTPRGAPGWPRRP